MREQALTLPEPLQRHILCDTSDRTLSETGSHRTSQAVRLPIARRRHPSFPPPLTAASPPPSPLSPLQLDATKAALAAEGERRGAEERRAEGLALQLNMERASHQKTGRALEEERAAAASARKQLSAAQQQPRDGPSADVGRAEVSKEAARQNEEKLEALQADVS